MASNQAQIAGPPTDLSSPTEHPSLRYWLGAGNGAHGGAQAALVASSGKPCGGSKYVCGSVSLLKPGFAMATAAFMFFCAVEDGW
jgi:hypothetical protein